MNNKENIKDFKEAVVEDYNHNSCIEIDDPEEGNEEDTQITEYELTSSPNDFNVKTIFDFMESGVFKIPFFQRNYVWDIKKASKLIESLILGLPVPQVFLYEEKTNSFLVIDGQQRLMSIYFFIKGKFPKSNKKTAELRKIYNEHNKIPDDVLKKYEYFKEFKLSLKGESGQVENKFNNSTYNSLESDYKSRFDLRPIRNVVIKQNKPTDDDSSMYEIFHRLNSGGVNLKPQEIRMSLYFSDFYKMLQELNENEKWRNNILGTTDLDPRMRDIEIILRGFAMMINGDNYQPSMIKFLNQFSKQCRDNSEEDNKHLKELFLSFLDACPKEAFLNQNKKVNLPLYESVFAAVCREPYDNKNSSVKRIDIQKIDKLKNDEDFVKATERSTSGTSNVNIRLEKGREILS